jgi:hypothetical protein
MTTEILKDDTDGRTIRLFGEYKYSVHEILACFGKNLCRFVKFEENEQSLSLEIPTTAMQSLVDAFTQWQQDLQKKAEAEQARIDALIAEADQLVKDTGVKVKRGDTWWQVSVPDAGWELMHVAYNAECYLAQVKDAVKAWQEHLKLLAKDTEFLNQALELAATIPDIELNEEPHKYGFHKKKWTVAVPGVYQAAITAMNGNELLNQVKAAKKAWLKTQPLEEETL